MRVIGDWVSIGSVSGLADWIIGSWYIASALPGAGGCMDEIYEVMCCYEMFMYI